MVLSMKSIDIVKCKMRKSTILFYFLLLIFVFIDINYAYRTETRIISGKEAAVGQFPWQTILKRDEFDDLLCGGSIIADNWVLTAGHCTYGLQSVFLIFGSIILDNPNACSMTSTQLFLHPQYESSTLHNDVSLILLPKKLSFSATIASIPLVSSAEVNNNLIGTLAVISGFGLVEDINLDFSENLLYAFVSVVSNEYCEQIYGQNIVINSTLCAIGASGSNMSICSGDSGGPLITKDKNGNFVQIGINSFVKQDSCTYKYPSGYARLSDFLEFIKDTIQQQPNITFL